MPIAYVERLIQYHHSHQSTERTSGVRQGNHSSWPCFLPVGGPSPIIVQTYGLSDPHAARQFQREDRQEQRESTAAFVGGIATLVLAGVSALFLKGYVRERQEWNAAMEFQRDELPQLDSPSQAQLRPILTKHLQIVEARLDKSRTIVILTGSILACAVAAFAGGMCSIPWLITASIVAGVTVGACGIFTVVWQMGDEPAVLSQQEWITLQQFRESQPGAV